MLTSRHLATCSADSTIKLWSTAGFEYVLERTLTGHQRWVWDAAFSADSAYLVTGEPSSSLRRFIKGHKTHASIVRPRG